MNKESHDQTLKSRIDYVLGTPSLSNAISDVKHIFHECELTDHATSYFSIDFTPEDRFPGVFRLDLCPDSIIRIVTHSLTY